jgi:hypothetical protein
MKKSILLFAGRKFFGDRRKYVAGIMIASFLGLSVPLLAAAPAQAACAPIIGIGVRGTGAPHGTGSGGLYESGGFGITKGILDDVEKRIPDTQIFGLNYPALAWLGPLPIPQASYLVSIEQGKNVLRETLESLSVRCSTSVVVLVGHSQGAQVIGDTLDSGTSPQLSATAKNMINSVVLLGDSSYTNGQPINSPKSATTGSSLFPRKPGKFSSYVARNPNSASSEKVPFIRSWCYTNDWACQNQRAWLDGKLKPIHENYGNSPTREAAAEFILSWLIDPD